MAEMRLPARLSVLLAGLLLLTLPALAAAKPHPIAKPDEHRADPAGEAGHDAHRAREPSTSSESRPSSTHSEHSTRRVRPPATTGLTSGNGTGSNGTNAPVDEQHAGRSASGRGHRRGRPRSVGHRGAGASAARAHAARAGRRRRSRDVAGTSTPAWKIALLALLAAAEAFLVVRLVRNRPGDLSPAQ